jgi:hypothetical protein
MGFTYVDQDAGEVVELKGGDILVVGLGREVIRQNAAVVRIFSISPVEDLRPWASSRRADIYVDPIQANPTAASTRVVELIKYQRPDPGLGAQVDYSGISAA